MFVMLFTRIAIVSPGVSDGLLAGISSSRMYEKSCVRNDNVVVYSRSSFFQP